MMIESIVVLVLFAADPPSPTDLGYRQDDRIPQRFIYTDREKPRWNNQLPHIVAIEGSGQPAITFNKDATQIGIVISEPQAIVLDTADKTQQFADGTWAFVANDGKIHGTNRKPRAFFENHKGNYRIGGWHQLDDYVTWDFNATRWGRYNVELTYSLGGGVTDVELDFAGSKVTGQIKSTGTWYKYITAPIGTVYLDAAGKKTLTFRTPKRTGGASLNLKAVILRPAQEGAAWPIKPLDDGSLTLHAKDARVDGVTLRYEPDPKKNCLGFWSNPNDRAQWLVQAPAGEYDIEIHQDCGKDQGGSEVDVRVGGLSHRFIVEDTGHFQNFKPRIIGRVKLDDAGAHSLKIVPVTKAKGAIMDVRQIRLIPVK